LKKKKQRKKSFVGLTPGLCRGAIIGAKAKEIYVFVVPVSEVIKYSVRRLIGSLWASIKVTTMTQ